MDRSAAQKTDWLTEEEYDFIYSRVPRFCVDLVVKNKQGEILYSLREIEPYKGLWHLPGGKLNFKESIEEAIQRIAKSELGVGVAVNRLLGYMEFLEETQKSQERHSASLAFLVELKNEDIQGSSQARNMKFFPQIPPNTHPIHAKFLASL